jgi:hypothetical protein
MHLPFHVTDQTRDAIGEVFPLKRRRYVELGLINTRLNIGMLLKR